MWKGVTVVRKCDSPKDVCQLVGRCDGHILKFSHNLFDSNVLTMCLRFQVWNLNNKRDIQVQKIKVGKSIFE